MLYRPDIDGLRGLAVLAVVAFHAWPNTLPWGFLGVDVFFVISGYLITSDIVRRMGAGTFTVADFYMRRVRRLFPALLTVLAAVVAFGAVVLYPDEREQLWRHVVASALFAQNFQLLGEAGYFDTASSTKPLLHLWSLAVEEQFYLLWPLLLAIRPSARTVAVIAMASLAAFFALPMDLAFYLPITRFWEILAGALMALAWRFPVMPTAQPCLVYLGRISYPLYLWHWPLLAYLRIMVPEPSTGATAAAVAVSFLLAAGTYRWIEQPLRTAGVLRERVKLLGGSSVAVVAMAFGVSLLPGDVVQADRIADLSSAPQRSAMKPCALPGGVCLKTADAPAFALVGDSHADHLFDAIAAADGRGWALSYRQSCPPLLGQNVRIGRSQCTSEALMEALILDKALQTVVLSFFGSYVETTNVAADHQAGGIGPADVRVEGPGADKAERIRAGLSATVRALLDGSKEVVLIVDVPELPFRPRDCITRALVPAHPCTVDRAAVLERQGTMRRIIADVQREHSSLRVFDPLDTICGVERCNVDRGGVLMYKDSHHLSLRGAALVGKPFVAWLAAQ